MAVSRPDDEPRHTPRHTRFRGKFVLFENFEVKYDETLDIGAEINQPIDINLNSGTERAEPNSIAVVNIAGQERLY